MTKPAPAPVADIVLLLLLLTTAAGVRVGYLLHYARHASTDGPFQVQENTVPDDLLQNLKEQRWFGRRAPLSAGVESTADLAPGYPWLVGELARLAAADTDATVLVRWAQCGLGSLTVAFYFLFARRAFPGRSVAVLAGLFCALHPFWIIDTAAVNDGTVASFLLGAALWLGVRGGRDGGPLTSLLYGVCLAALALVRAALLPFAFAAVLWFLWRSRSLPGGWMAALLAFLGFGTALAPWSIHQFETFQDVLPIVDSTYLYLWEGNNPRATGGPLPEADLIAALAETRSESPETTAAWLAAQGQPERYRCLSEAVLAELQRDPVAALRRRLVAATHFVFGFAPDGNCWRETPTPAEDGELLEQAPFPAALTGSLLAMLLLGFLGWRWTYGWRRSAMPSSLALMWVPLPYLLGHAEMLSGPRLPLDGVLLSYAAFALVYLLPVLGAPLRAGEKDETSDP